ncbi:cyclase family protein [Thalassoglobus sp. JC818]|uniref:cyclase family protein n=1 Tax=Thalassoglobus sp. JC818 TaxID=3232136 RepID=UPI00345ABD26
MRVVDLSLTVNSEMPGVSITTAKTIASDGWNATTLSLYSHSGTHMDAPCHFLDGGSTIDQHRLEVLVGPAIVLDLSPANPRQLATVEDVQQIKDHIRPGCRILFRTDWSRRYGTAEYRNELPRISLELAEWLVKQKVGLIGVEPPSVADVNNIEELTKVHQTLFRGNVVIVEGLTNLDQLTQQTVEFIALPLKIEHGDGCPVRAIAIERESFQPV